MQSLVESSNDQIKVIENVQLTEEAPLTDVIQRTFASTTNNPIPIHLLVHNGGAYGPPEDIPHDDESGNIYLTQTLEAITRHRMRFAFELNTLAPLHLTQLLMPNLLADNTPPPPTTSATTKVIIVSSVMGSMDENSSGGHYGYRASKAAVNMVGKSLSMDLKEKGIAVGLGA